MSFRSWFEKNGAHAFRKNIERNPWRRVGHPEFDGLAKAIFRLVLDGDPRAMNWDPPMQRVVGLWDQAIHGIHTLKKLEANDEGDIEESQRVEKDPLKQNLATVVRLSTSSGANKFIDKCRRYAHTLQAGKRREDVVEEFVAEAEDLFVQNGEPIPPPTPPLEEDQTSMASSEETEEDEEYAQIGYKTLPVKGGHRASAADALSETNSESTSMALSSSVDSSPVGSQEKSLAAWDPRNMLSKEWWNPQRGLLVAGATGLAVALTVGGVYLANKFLRGKQKGHGQRTRRAHARSWNIVDVNSGEIPVRLH